LGCAAVVWIANSGVLSIIIINFMVKQCGLFLELPEEVSMVSVSVHRVILLADFRIGFCGKRGGR
jgi:hypothetical protein